MPRGQGEGMDTIRLAVLFDDDTIARAVHRYTGDFFVEFSRSGPGIEILLTPMRADVDTTSLPQRFANDLLDERLRAKIAQNQVCFTPHLSWPCRWQGRALDRAAHLGSI